MLLNLCIYVVLKLRLLSQVCYSCGVVLVILHEIRTIKFDAMEFFGRKGNIARMMGAIFVAVYGINTMCLMYFLAFKWEVVIESLRSLNFRESMYLSRTRAQVNQVLDILFMSSKVTELLRSTKTFEESRGYMSSKTFVFRKIW